LMQKIIKQIDTPFIRYLGAIFLSPPLTAISVTFIYLSCLSFFHGPPLEFLEIKKLSNSVIFLFIL